MDHCTFAFKKEHEKWSIADCFFRKQTWNGDSRVFFSESAREMSISRQVSLEFIRNAGYWIDFRGSRTDLPLLRPLKVD